MHELSIAQNILEIVRQNVPANAESSVKVVRVRIGEMAGVVPDSLEFCFTAIVKDTSFPDAVLAIERVPFILVCSSCGKRFRSEAGLAVCPSCGSLVTTVVSGTELQVVEIELDDIPQETS
jgi:hydrogenase nickel incorporation protein HypA/HybF